MSPAANSPNTMQVVFVTEYGPHQVGDRDEIPIEIARKLIEKGVCYEYKGSLKVSQPQPKRKLK